MDELYELNTLKNLETLPIGTWYPFESKNHVKEKLLEVVKLRIRLCNDFLISNDYTHFKRIENAYSELKSPDSREITHSIQWREDTGQQTEKELNLEPKIKAIDDKKWQKLKGRA